MAFRDLLERVRYLMRGSLEAGPPSMRLGVVAAAAALRAGRSLRVARHDELSPLQLMAAAAASGESALWRKWLMRFCSSNVHAHASLTAK